MKSSKALLAVSGLVLIMYAVGWGVSSVEELDVVEDGSSVVCVASGGGVVVGSAVGSGLEVGSGSAVGSGVTTGSGLGTGLGTGTGTTVTMGTTTIAPSESVEVEEDTVEVDMETSEEPPAVSDGPLVVAVAESSPVLVAVDSASVAVAVSVAESTTDESAVVVAVVSVFTVDAIVPVTEAVKVTGAVVTEIVPRPGSNAAQAGISMQKGPPQVKDWTPQQSSGTTNVSPTARSLTPGLAPDKQVTLRKVSVATWSRELPPMGMSCACTELRSSAVAAERTTWGRERGILKENK